MSDDPDDPDDPHAPRDPRDRRREPRFPARIEVDYAADATFLFAYITDISSLGIFIQTEQPQATGTRLELKFAPPEGAVEGEGPFDLVGEVVWIASADGPHEPGMGVRFIDLDEKTQNRLLDLIKAIAYLDEPGN